MKVFRSSSLLLLARLSCVFPKNSTFLSFFFLLAHSLALSLSLRSPHRVGSRAQLFTFALLDDDFHTLISHRAFDVFHFGDRRRRRDALLSSFRESHTLLVGLVFRNRFSTKTFSFFFFCCLYGYFFFLLLENFYTHCEIFYFFLLVFFKALNIYNFLGGKFGIFTSFSSRLASGCSFFHSKLSQMCPPFHEKGD